MILQDVEAADARQADVEHHRVDVLFLHDLRAPPRPWRPQHTEVASEDGRQRSRMPSSSSTTRTVFRRSGIGGASIARLLDTSEFPSITWSLDCRTMTLLWLVTGASLAVALIALGQARRTARASSSSRRITGS